MKIYDIALFMFMFSLSLSILGTGVAFSTPNGDIAGLNLMCGIGKQVVYTNGGCTDPTLNVSANYKNGQNYYDTYTEASGNLNKMVNATQPDATSNPITAVASGLNIFYTIVIGGIIMILQVLWNATFGFGTMLSQFGVPALISFPLTIIINFLFFFGMVQYITGKSTREYQ